MNKYSRVLVIIFFLGIVNLGLSVFVISRLNQNIEIKPAPAATTIASSPTPQSKATTGANLNTDEIKSDLTLIKAEIRALREILGVTGSFEELLNLLKTMGQTEKP